MKNNFLKKCNTNNVGISAITLIALIITIIVMLILAGVTINIAINGGLFQQASNAVAQTDIALTREQVQAAIVAKQLESSSYGRISKNGLTAVMEKLITDGIIKDYDKPIQDAEEGKLSVTAIKTKNGNTFNITDIMEESTRADKLKEQIAIWQEQQLTLTGFPVARSLSVFTRDLVTANIITESERTTILWDPNYEVVIDGEPIRCEIIGRVKMYGDGNLDGVINFSDYTLFAIHFEGDEGDPEVIYYSLDDKGTITNDTLTQVVNLYGSAPLPIAPYDRPDLYPSTW